MGRFLLESGSDSAWKPRGLSFLLCPLSLQPQQSAFGGEKGMSRWPPGLVEKGGVAGGVSV